MQGVYLAQEGERNTVYDSSLISDGIMSHNLYNRGEFPKILYKDYLRLNNVMQRNVNGHPFMGPSLIVYLDMPFSMMLEHIAKRGRKMETTDPHLKEYYHSVWQIYKDWYKSYGESPVLKIDMKNRDFVGNIDDRNYVLDKIEHELVNLGELSPKEAQKLHTERVDSNW